MWTVEALEEYTLNRLWALKSRTPPAPGTPGATVPTDAELATLGEDLYTINKKALDAAFERQRDLERRENGDTGPDDDAAKATALAAWQRDRKADLRDQTKQRWAQRRPVHQAAIKKLTEQLDALAVVKFSGGRPSNVNMDPNILRTPSSRRLITAWVQKGNKWPKQLANPKLRLPKIRNFLSMPGRSEEAKGWLRLQRDEHSSQADHSSDIYGSAYGPDWPRAPTSTNSPPDHVTPIRWFEGGTRLLLECGDPAQLPAVVICQLGENSAKGDKALGLFSSEDDSEAAVAGQGVYAPNDVSEEKKAMLAKMAVWVWGLYPLISDKMRSTGIGTYESSTGCAWWGRAWETGPFKEQVDQEATPFERRIQLLTMGIQSWRVGNPLVFGDPSQLLDYKMRSLIKRRFKGEDKLPKLVDRALQAAVALAPR